MDIVACTDNGYVMPTGVMMFSVCCNNADVDIVFHIIAGGVGAEGKEKLIKTIKPFKNKSIIFYDGVKLDTSDFPLMKNCHYPISAFFRLFLAELLPTELEKVIYLDVDIIVRQSLLPLWNVDLGGYSLAAVPDWWCEKCTDFSERLGYPKELGYFNSGALLINLEYWRSHNVFNDFIEYMKQRADNILFADQDVLNYIFRESKMTLPIKYNFASHIIWKCVKVYYDEKEYNQAVQEALHDCTILHFTTTTKPWHTSCSHPFRSSFLKYYRQTPWGNDPLQETRPLKLRIIKFFSTKLRKLKLIPELPPYGDGFISGLKPLD